MTIVSNNGVFHVLFCQMTSRYAFNQRCSDVSAVAMVNFVHLLLFQICCGGFVAWKQFVTDLLHEY